MICRPRGRRGLQFGSRNRFRWFETGSLWAYNLAFHRSVGRPASLADLGLASHARQTLEAVTERAVDEGETAHHELFTVSAQMIFDGILAADAIQRDSSHLDDRRVPTCSNDHAMWSQAASTRIDGHPDSQ